MDAGWRWNTGTFVHGQEATELVTEPTLLVIIYVLVAGGWTATLTRTAGCWWPTACVGAVEKPPVGQAGRRHPQDGGSGVVPDQVGEAERLV